MRSTSWICGVVVVMVAATALAQSQHAAARSPAPRVERASYLAPGGVSGSYGFYVVGTGIGGVEFAGGSERAVSIEVKDQTGLPVAAEVQQFSDSDETFDADAVSYRICGTSDGPLRIRPNRTVFVLIYAGPCDDLTPAAATSGEVTATFTRTKTPKR